MLLKRITAALVLLACVTPASIAAEPILLVYPSGYFLLETVDGQPRVNPFPYRVIDLRNGGTPDQPPTPPTDPDQPEPDLTLTRQAQGWAASIGDPATAQALALAYRQVAEEVGQGKLSVDAAIVAIRDASDSVLARLLGTDKTKWNPFRDNVSQSLTDHKQRGKVANSAGMLVFLNAIAHGLELSADGTPQITTATMVVVADQVNMAIDRAKR